MIGTARTSSGRSSTTVDAVFRSPWTDTAARRKPRTSAPESPMKIRAGKKLWRRKPMQAPATMAERIAGSVFPSESESTAKVTPAIPHTPAARPSIPSRKLTMFITATIQSIGQRHTHGCRQVDGAEERKREVVDPHAEERRNGGGEDLAGQLRGRTEDAEVVDRADDGRHRCAEQHAPRLPAELEERERRDEDPEEEREPAEPRDRVDVQPPAVRPVDDAEKPRHAAHRRSEQDHDHERDDRAVEDLGVLPKRVHGIPISSRTAGRLRRPGPGTM